MASGVMTIKYGSNGIRNKANSAASAFDSAADRLNTVARRLDGMEERSRHGYIRDASAFLRAKEAQYRKKETALRTFAAAADSFMDSVKQADKRVASHLEQSYSSFKKITGLSMSGLILNMLRRLGEGIKNLASFAWTFITGCVQRLVQMTVKIAVAVKNYVLRVAKRVWNVAKNLIGLCVTVIAVVAAFKALVAFAAVATVGGTIMAILAACGVVFGGIKALYQGFDTTLSIMSLGTELVCKTELADTIASISAASMMAQAVYNISGGKLNYDALVKTFEGIEIISYIGSALGSIPSFIHSAGLLKDGKIILNKLSDTFLSEFWKNINPKHLWSEAKKIAVNFDVLKTPIDAAIIGLDFVVSGVNIIMPDFGRIELNPLNFAEELVKKFPGIGDMFQAIQEKIPAIKKIDEGQSKYVPGWNFM